MKIKYRYLTDIPIETVQRCMQDSFADYQLDMSYMTVEVMKHRNAICRNDPECSVGAFEGDKMIGFLNVGIDQIDGELVAFDGGTGVVKEYRGQGVAGKMFAKSVDSLKEKNIQKYILEVLQENTKAIRAYEKEGFKVLRNLKCYDIAIKNYTGITTKIPNVQIKAISVNELESNWHFIKYPVSWEHMLSGLMEVEKEISIFGAFENENCIGFIVYTPFMCWLTAIGINPMYLEKNKLIDLLIGHLFENINPVKPKVSVNNLTEKDPLNDILKSLGFDNVVDQYEMIAEI